MESNNNDHLMQPLMYKDHLSIIDTYNLKIQNSENDDIKRLSEFICRLCLSLIDD